MGAGKSTVGRRLSNLLQQPLRDTDTDVEKMAGKPIAEIFIDDGEAHFRELEHRAVALALAEHRGVLSLGGGAVLHDETRRLLNGHPVVFLNVSMPIGVRRTGMATNRPLLVGMNPRATYKALLDGRLPIYRSVAVLEVDTDHLTPGQLAQRIAGELRLT